MREKCKHDESDKSEFCNQTLPVDGTDLVIRISLLITVEYYLILNRSQLRTMFQ